MKIVFRIVILLFVLPLAFFLVQFPLSMLVGDDFRPILPFISLISAIAIGWFLVEENRIAA